MDYLLIVRPEPEGQFTAQVMGIPEIRAVAATQARAIQEAKRLLTEWLAKALLVRVHLPVPAVAHPATEFAGQAENDPLFDEYLEEIARYRREEDERECSDSSSTPTT
jgi:predicted RNase H-like HicB family nuclease